MDADYTAANAAWPAVIPPSIRAEAVRAVQKLVRHFGHGRRVIRAGYVPQRWISSRGGARMRGWDRLVHDLSHTLWAREAPGAKDHGKWHADLERQMVQYVVARGWLDGKLKSAPRRATPPTPDEKLAKIRAAMMRWTSKRKRAETALKKLQQRVRYYERKQRTLSHGKEAVA